MSSEFSIAGLVRRSDPDFSKLTGLTGLTGLFSDGLSNLLEFTFDLDPTQPDSPTRLEPSLVGGFFEFTYTPRADHLGYVTIHPQSSTDAKSWDDIDVSNITENPNGSYTARIAASEPGVFGQLEVSVTE